MQMASDELWMPSTFSIKQRLLIGIGLKKEKIQNQVAVTCLHITKQWLLCNFNNV